MLRLLIPTGSGYTWVEHEPPAPFPDEFLWADLFEPTADEERAIESLLTIDVPTRDEMKEIEASNRLYEEGGVVYMTATVGTNLDTATPVSSALTFILTSDRLITNRYADPTPIRRFMAHVERSPAACTSAPTLLAGLIEAFVERVADVLERVQGELDELSSTIFPRSTGASASSTELRSVIHQIGADGDLVSKSRESLVSLQRLLMFIQQVSGIQISPDQRGRFKTSLRDVQSLSDHATFLSSKVSFMLDAVLGLINLEQSNIIKIFSVAAVMFLPPTLVASIYGMNFHFMPELDEAWGYPVALFAMAVSALVPYLYFKRRGWL